MPTNAALSSAIAATRAYQASLTARGVPAASPRPDAAPEPAARPLSAQALARLAAPEVSRLIAREIRERRSWP